MTRPLAVLPASVAVVVTAFVLGTVLSRLDLGDPWDHASGHAVGAVAAALIVLLGWKDHARVSPRPVRLAQTVLLIGLAAFGLGQGLEFAGAFHAAGDTGLRARLEGLHDLGTLVGVPGLVVTMLGVLLSALMWVAERFNLMGSKWVQVGVGLALVAVALFVAGGVIFGY